MAAPASLIINSPYARPGRHWQQAHGGALSMVEGRHDAGYEIFDIRNNTRRTESLALVNSIRERVDAWRAKEYPGITSVTRTLLEHWNDKSARQLPFYFCQIEAIETLIWCVEAPDDSKQLGEGFCGALRGVQNVLRKPAAPAQHGQIEPHDVSGRYSPFVCGQC